MDEIYESRTGVHTENPFLPSEAPAIGTTRKVFVTCEGRGSLDPNASTRIVDAITFFLREKVFPVVGDHCRINIHWDGSDLSTLHVRSVVPNSHLLVLRTAAHNEPSPERAPSSLYFEHGRQVAPLRSPPATVTVKEEPIDFTRKTLLSEDDIKQEINVDRDNASSDDGKRDSDEQVEFSDSEEPIADSHDGLNVSGHSFMESGKPYANFRPVPPMPIPPPISSAAAAYSMYLPQSPMIPMIPLMAFGQSQPYSQAIPLLVPAMQTMPQVPIPGLPQMLPAYSDLLPAPGYSDLLPTSVYNEFPQAPYPMPPFPFSLLHQPQSQAHNNALLYRHGRYM